MVKRICAMIALAAVPVVAPASAQDTVKIGVIMPYSGALADTAFQMDGGLKLYLKLNGNR